MSEIRTMPFQPGSIVVVRCNNREHAEAVVEEQLDRGREAFILLGVGTKKSSHIATALWLGVALGVVPIAIMLILLRLVAWMGLV